MEDATFDVQDVAALERRSMCMSIDSGARLYYHGIAALSREPAINATGVEGILVPLAGAPDGTCWRSREGSLHDQPGVCHPEFASQPYSKSLVLMMVRLSYLHRGRALSHLLPL